MKFVRDSAKPAERRRSSSPSLGAEASGLSWHGGAFPADAVASISRPAPSLTSSGRAHERQWTLHFERRSPPFTEPLMGWTGGSDTLSQVELSFPSRESAIGFAEREGLAYRVETGAERRAKDPNPELQELQAELQKVLATA